MRLKLFIVSFLIFLSSALFVRAQPPVGYTQPRILILLDESSSMLQEWSGGKIKNKIATEIILRLMDSVYAVNNNVEFSLRVFGSQHTVQEHECTDTRNEVPFSKLNRTQMEFRLEDLRPLGVTSIAYSLARAAEEDLIDEAHHVYSIVLVTDGGESCNGDICGVMNMLLKNKVFFKPYVLSLEDVPGLKSEYACMGNYLTVSQGKHIGTAITTIVDAFRPMLKISKVDYTEILKLKVPSALNLSHPVTHVEQNRDSVLRTIALPKKPVVVDRTPTPDPTPTPAPTPAPKVKEKEHSIAVGEAPKKPDPITLTKVKPLPLVKLYVRPTATYKPMAVAMSMPNIAPPEPDFVAPPPTVLSRLAVTKMASLPVTKLAKFTAVAAQLGEPNVALPEVPATLPPPTKLKTALALKAAKLPVATATTYKPAIIFVLPLELKLPEPEQVAPTALKMGRLKPVTIQRFATSKVPTFTAQAYKLSKPVIKLPEVPVEPVPVVKAPDVKKVPVVTDYPVSLPVEQPHDKPDALYTKPVALQLPKLKFAKFKMHLLYGGSFFDSDLKLLKLPTPPPLKPIPTSPTTTTNTTTKPAPAPQREPVKGEYTESHEDASQTTLEVLITNGKGKFYTTTPQLRLMDATTRKETKKFYRTVDPDGNPDAIANVTPGKYNMGIVGRTDLIYPIEVMPGKKNRVTIVIKAFSLFFYYDGAPDRPVTEFTATVIQRNTPNGKIVDQKCTERLEYEPGNYHITINTLPEEARNIDLDISVAGGIAILQPGFVKFTTEAKINTVGLFMKKGDHYLQFYTLGLRDPASQHFQLQPGVYQVHYNDGSSKFSSSEKSIDFTVRSLEEQEITLK